MTQNGSPSCHRGQGSKITWFQKFKTSLEHDETLSWNKVGEEERKEGMERKRKEAGVEERKEGKEKLKRKLRFVYMLREFNTSQEFGAEEYPPRRVWQAFKRYYKDSVLPTVSSFLFIEENFLKFSLPAEVYE